MESLSNPMVQPPMPPRDEERARMDPHHDPSWEALSRLPRSAERHVSTGAYVGMLTAIGATGELLVECESAAPGRSLAARTTVPVTEQDIGREVVVMFEQADPGRPIIMGLLQPAPGPMKSGGVLVQRDGDSLTLTADREIVLRCGEASITLTRAGKVLLRGAYLLSRSSGVNRIKGGSVQIN